MIWNGQDLSLIAKETQELLKNWIFSKFSNDLKNFSRHCGGLFSNFFNIGESFTHLVLKKLTHVKTYCVVYFWTQCIYVSIISWWRLDWVHKSWERSSTEDAEAVLLTLPWEYIHRWRYLTISVSLHNIWLQLKFS